MSARRVVVIDDDDDIRAVARLALERVAGWEVHLAASGPEGVDLAARVRPDAILLDVMMPGVDGPATVELLRARAETAAVPVVLLTASTTADDRRRLESLGVAGLVPKPFDPLTVHRDVAAVLGWT
ncbi:MAG TPA: response regulator [Acidimicrobiales bacterium]|nr:response regulator [Acidimicrobiales bacterium]